MEVWLLVMIVQNQFVLTQILRISASLYWGLLEDDGLVGLGTAPPKLSFQGRQQAEYVHYGKVMTPFDECDPHFFWLNLIFLFLRKACKNSKS